MTMLHLVCLVLDVVTCGAFIPIHLVILAIDLCTNKRKQGDQ